MTAMQKDRDCYGSVFAEYPVSGANWDSSDWSIVDVYNGAATAVGVGSAMITASWETQYYLDSGSDTCDEYPIVAAPSGEMVVSPRITNITPSRGGVGSITRVTIDGSGFIYAPTVNAGSGISISIFSFSNTQIVADFAIDSNATGGNRSVTVIGSGQTSNAVNFFVQIPTSLLVVSVTTLPTGTSPSTSGCVPSTGDYGIKVAVKYQVRDQSSTPAPITNDKMVPQETIKNAVENGVSQGDPVPDFVDIGPSRITGTSRTTDANGQFLDAAYGSCYPYSFTYTFTQVLRILIDGTQSTYNVRTNNVAVTGTVVGAGSITNGSDIQKSRP